MCCFLTDFLSAQEEALSPFLLPFVRTSSYLGADAGVRVIFFSKTAKFSAHVTVHRTSVSFLGFARAS